MKNSTKPKLNVRLLRRIQKHILARPSRFMMAWFFSRGLPGTRAARWSDQAKRFPSCGTTACIAGWANILTGAKTYDTIVNIARAGNKLGLEPDSQGMYPLFGNHLWPEEFRTRYREAKTPMQRVSVASDVIDDLIARSVVKP